MPIRTKPIHSALSASFYLPMMFCFLLISQPMTGQAQGFSQPLEKFNRFAQTANASEAATKVLLEGRTLITNKNWAKAEERFKYLLTQYPHSDNMDVALYWMAYAQKNQNKLRDAEATLMRLINDYSTSNWMDDALALRVEIAARLSNHTVIEQETTNANDEIKIAALNSLFQADPARATTVASEMLKRNSQSSVPIKDVALTLVAQYGDNSATPMLIEMARNETNLGLRRKAVSLLAWRNDETAFSALKEIANNSTDPDTAEIALWAIASNGKFREQAYSFISDIAKSSQTEKVRIQAVLALGRYESDQAFAELIQIYKSANDVEIKKAVIMAFGFGSIYYMLPGKLFPATPYVFGTTGSAGFGSGVSGGVGAGSANRPPVPKTTIAAPQIATVPPAGWGQRGSLVTKSSAPSPTTNSERREKAAAALAQLYDAERSEELRLMIVSAMARADNKATLTKLMAIAKNDSSLEVKKRAILALGQSKDPEVVRFLEDLLK